MRALQRWGGGGSGWGARWGLMALVALGLFGCVQADPVQPIPLSPPPVPDLPRAMALDGAVYLHWGAASRGASDFHRYRIYLYRGPGDSLLIGETDSEGFLDLRAENGLTSRYFLTAVNRRGAESTGSVLVVATPRPDYRGELLYAFEDRPASSGFRFQSDDAYSPIVHGLAGDRHLRLEVDAQGWWLVPAPGVQLHANAFHTSELRCGPAADSGCVELAEAPASNYLAQDIGILPGRSYAVRVPSAGGEWRYGVIRIVHLGFDQSGAMALFDWAWQLQPGNRALAPPNT